MWSEAERLGVERMLAVSAVGGPETVAAQLQHLIDATGADELILAGAIHDPAARQRSYSIAMQCMTGRSAAASGALSARSPSAGLRPHSGTPRPE
jgi:hypothetical protein